MNWCPNLIDSCEDKTVVNRVQLTAGTTSESAFAASSCKKSHKSKK
jgi:hypothetical protein